MGIYRAPIDVPDRKEAEEPLLYGPDGKQPILVRKPHPFGFHAREPRPHGLGGDDGPRESGVPPTRGE